MKSAARIRFHESSFAHEGVVYGFSRYEREEDDDFDFTFDASSGFASAALARVPFVLLHGFAQSAASWDEIAHLLLSGREGEAPSFESDGIGAVYALDFVGHGLSDHPASAAPYDMDEACACVKAFVDWVARREGARPVLVGYSMGGRIALEALVRYGVVSKLELPARRVARAAAPELAIAGLVLESAGLGPADEAARESLRERNLGWAKQVREDGVEAFMEYWESLPLFESQRALPEAKRASVWAGRLENRAESLARSFEGTGQHRQTLRAESLAALARAQGAGLPVMYVAGALDAKYLAVARCVADKLPGHTSSIRENSHFCAKNCGFERFENAGEGKRKNAPGVSAGQRPDFSDALNGVPEVGQNRAEKSCKTEKNYRKLSDCSYEVFGAGHNVHLEQPEEYARLLGAFAAAI